MVVEELTAGQGNPQQGESAGAVSLYDILGCRPDADAVSIRSAWVNKIKELHASNRKVGVRNTNSHIQQLNKVYDVLKSPRLKAVYDQYFNDGENIARKAVESEQEKILKIKKNKIKPAIKIKPPTPQVDRLQKKFELERWRAELAQQKQDRKRAELEFYKKFPGAYI